MPTSTSGQIQRILDTEQDDNGDYLHSIGKANVSDADFEEIDQSQPKFTPQK